jgi:hypothetical protein
MGKKGNRAIALTRLKLGDTMYRHSHMGLVEEAMVVSMRTHPSEKRSWTAVLMTQNGVEFVSSDKEFRGRNDWVPTSWMYDDQHSCWVVPIGGEARPNVVDWQLPAPDAGEKYMSWRARVFREVPALKAEKSATAILSNAWNSRDGESATA